MSRWWLAAGVVGRTWLWFIAGCLLVTLVPILFGWRPYVVESGSMAPRINVGDVVLGVTRARPVRRCSVTSRSSTTRTSPARSRRHRVVAIDDDGLLVTKGDANPTTDSQHVPVEAVHGIGRLLVRCVGLPLIWLQQRAWLPFLLFVLSLIGAAYSSRGTRTRVGRRRPAR